MAGCGNRAWSFAENPNEAHLTDGGLALVEYIRSSDLDSEFVSERSISYRMGFYGREHCIEPYLYEVRQKALIALNWEAKGMGWGERPMYRLWIGTEKLEGPATPNALNPVFAIHLEIFKKD